MKYIITGGGTGGHIYPAIAIANIIREKESSSEVLYVGTEYGLESELVPRANLPFRTVRVTPIPRKIGIPLLKSGVRFIQGVHDARQILKEFRPDVVIGTGGFVSGPVVFAAMRCGIPTVIHEANAFPGLANRFLSKNASAVCLTFSETAHKMNIRGTCHVTGNPIRPNFFVNAEKDVLKKYGFEKELPVVLSFGGSGGQRSLNNAVAEMIQSEGAFEGFQLAHITGRRLYSSFMDQMKGFHPSHFQVYDYSYDMPELMNAADLIITSSGVMTLTEVSCCALPSILIPKAYVTENHQEYNARAYVEAGASVMILERDLNGRRLLQEITELISKPDLLRNMGERSGELFVTDSNERIYEVIQSVIR